MNWEEIGAIGQVLGSVAVFITLVYLAIQTRHARQESRRALSEGRLQSARQLTFNRVNNERLNSVLVRANAALGTGPGPFVTAIMQRTGLTEEDANLIFSDQWAWWMYRSQVIAHIDELPPGERTEFETSLRASHQRTPVYGVWYEAMKGFLNPDAVRYVDNLLAQPN